MCPGAQGLLEHDTRQAIDLHDQETPVGARRGPAAAETPDETIERMLDRQDGIVQRHQDRSSGAVMRAMGDLAGLIGPRGAPRGV